MTFGIVQDIDAAVVTLLVDETVKEYPRSLLKQTVSIGQTVLITATRILPFAYNKEWM